MYLATALYRFGQALKVAADRATGRGTTYSSTGFPYQYKPWIFHWTSTRHQQELDFISGKALPCGEARLRCLPLRQAPLSTTTAAMHSRSCGLRVRFLFYHGKMEKEIPGLKRCTSPQGNLILKALRAVKLYERPALSYDIRFYR